MYSHLIEPFLTMAESVSSLPELRWIDDSVSTTDLQLLEAEANPSSPSNIDTANFRQEMIDAWKQKRDGVSVFARELPGYTRVVAIGTRESFKNTDWALWARCFQAISQPIGYVLYYMNTTPRAYPPVGTPVEAKHINGGYSYICSQTKIIIYRFEESARVLLHELLHTACFDKELPVEDLEASTEAWTELLITAILSKGSRRRFATLWNKQTKWIEVQVDTLKREYGVKDRRDYAWRYITGKYELLVAKGFIKPAKSVSMANVERSLRFVSPELL
jgi:hypothetical protein